MSSRRGPLIALLMAAGATFAGAQCPDGTPPPCRNVAGAAPRRANPQLNARAWIVVPFGNVTRSPELEWLRDASVNLLSLDLSRWTDISVVDDKRVGDLVRELPAARTGATLTLNDGLALARRAGAGTLVMGDFYKLGNGARIAANVFDVKSGSRLRSVTQQAPNQDSLLTAFGPLARGVLALPPPSGVKLGATGTTSVDAYQEYLLGAAALNRFELTAATQHLLRALTFDSTFALAHYKLSVAFHWGERTDSTAERMHAATAARLGGTLPPRERALITARVASANDDDPRACATLGALVAHDSSDVEALYALGECQYHGVSNKPEEIDSMHARLPGNWNTAIALFRRVLRLDPTYHPAFAHILDALSIGNVVFCTTFTVSCANDPTSWTTIVVRDGDSLLTVPVRGADVVKERIRQSERNRSRYLNLRAAQGIAREWVDAGPAEVRARLQLGEVDMRLGEFEEAAVQLAQIGAASDPAARRSALVDRIELAVFLGRGAVGRALLDSMRREVPDEALRRRTLGVIPAAFGQMRAAVAFIDDAAKDRQWSSERTRYWEQLPMALLGLPRPELADAERKYWETLPGDSVCAAGLPRCRVTGLLPSMAYALRLPRAWWPPFEVPVIGFRFGPARGLAIGDTSYLRAEMRYLDSTSRARFVAFGDDQGTSVIALDAALALRDSVEALRLARQFIDSVMPGIMRLTTSVLALVGPSRDLLVPRVMLQRADLAAALGHPDEARIWYARVLDLWAEADPELQPTVARIRSALNALGPPKR